VTALRVINHSSLPTATLGGTDSLAAGPTTVARDASLWILAALLPVVASAAAIFVNVDSAQWWSMPQSTKRALRGDALFYTAVAVVLLAPLIGVAAAQRLHRERTGRSDALDTTWSLVVTVAIFVASSAALMVFGWGSDEAGGFGPVATSHATFFAVALALAAFGALCSAMFTDSLDAAGFSLAVVLVMSGALLVAGSSLVNAPRALIDVALAANPLVTMASAAHIDVMRMDLPYQMSPLAHTQVHYLSWQVACALYLTVAGVCFLGLHWRGRSWQLASVRLKGQIA
jgi:hypothetical protein